MWASHARPHYCPLPLTPSPALPPPSTSPHLSTYLLAQLPPPCPPHCSLKVVHCCRLRASDVCSSPVLAGIGIPECGGKLAKARR